MNQKFQPGSSHKARKRFGQNFLVDHNIINRIVSAVYPKKDQTLVEIGPGQGAITQPLAERCDHLRVIELDRDLVPWLKVKFEKHPDFQLHQADALKFDFSTLVREQEPIRIVGNLPYNISTPLIFHLLSYAKIVTDMHFMLQKEVVKRMAASPGEKAYGRLSIMTQYYSRVESLFEVPPEAFNPAPKVFSAIVRLTPFDVIPHPTQHIKTLERIVSIAFQQRRKTVRNALKPLLTIETIDSLPINTSVRPENLSVEDYVNISDFLGELDNHESPQ